MKKKIFSILLLAAMIFSILPVSYANASSDLILLEQNFAGLTQMPDGWTILGEQDVNYSFSQDSLSTALVKSNAYAKAYKNDKYDTLNQEYQVSFGFSHYGGAKSYIHIGTDKTDSAVLEKAAPVGYSILFTTTDYKKATIKLYKNGTEIGVLTDKGSNYAHSSIRKFVLSVSDNSVTLSGANNTLTIEDDEPIYSGYVGFALKNNNSSTNKTRISNFNITKTLKYTGSNISGLHGILDDIELDFNCSLDEESVTQDNVYITDEKGNRIPESDYNVTPADTRVIISFNTELGYKKDYNVVVTTGLYADGTTIGLATNMTIPFTTQEPPFYVTVEGTSLEARHGISDNIVIEFSHELEPSTVSVSTVYVTNEGGTKLDENLFDVEYVDNKVVISFNDNLEYNTNYKVVLEKELYAVGTKIGMADREEIGFTTVDVPFYIRNSFEDNVLKITIGNTMYEPQDFKVFVKAKNDSGENIGSYSFEVSMPQIGNTAEYTKEVTENLEGAVIEVYMVSLDNTPMLESFADLDSEKSNASEIYEKNLTDEGKKIVADELKSTAYTDIDSLYTDFAKAAVAASINNSKEEGTSHISRILKKNAEFIGLDLSEYNTAVDTSDLDDFIYNYGVKTIEDLYEAVKQAILETDRAYYTHTVTSADKVESDWDFYISGDPDTSRVTDSGFTSANTINSAQMISKFEINGDYELGGSFTRSYNDLLFYFNYIDSNNYCYVKFSYSNDTRQSTTIARVEGGTSTVYLSDTSDGSFGSKKVVVEEDGYVTIVNTSGEKITDRIDVGERLEGGKIGFGLQHTPGSIKTVNVLRYLRGSADVTAENVDINTQNIGITFNYHINPATALKENVKLYENGKELTDFVVEPRSDYTGFDIILPQTLKYKSKYEIVLTTKIKVGFGKSYLPKDQTITFKTIKPMFNILSFEGVCGDDNVFTNNMDTVNEVYTATSPITAFADKDVTVKLTAENSNTNADSVCVVFELADKNGKTIWNSGIIPASVSNSTSPYPINETVRIPADITDDAKFSYFVFDAEDKLHTVYPYKDNISLGTGEKPEISKKGNEVTVWGSTISAKADKNVNLLIKGDTNGEIIKTASTTTDENGEYKFTFELNPELLTASGYVNVNISGEEFEKAVSQKLYVAKSGDRNNAVKDINQRTDTKSAISEYAKVLDVNSANIYGLKLYEGLDEPELNQLALLVDNDKPYNETDNGEQFLKSVLEKIVIVHYNNGHADMLYSADGEMITNDIIDFSKINASAGVYSIYASNITENGRKSVRSGMLNKNCKTVGDLCKVFAQNVVAYGVNNWNLNGTGHIYNLLTQNASAAGLDTSKYVSCTYRTSFEQGLLNTPVSSFSDLQSRINAIQSAPGGGGSGSGGTGGGGGGGNGSGAGPSTGGGFDGTVSGSFGTPSSAIGSGTANRFKDLSGFDWAKTAIEYLAEYKITNGYGDETFRPANEIVREEFVTLVVKAFSLTVGPNAPENFKDVDSSAWYAEYIKAAQANKIIEGYDGAFGVGTSLTRQDAVVILARVLETLGYDINSAEETIANYGDVNEISEYAYDSFNKLVSAGIINGVGNNLLAPKANCKRAEMAVMLYNVLMRYNIE